MSDAPDNQAPSADTMEPKGEAHLLPPENNSGGNMEGREHRKFALANKKMDHEHRQQKGLLGALGWVFGGRDEKAGNIAGLMALACFIAIVTLLLNADSWENVDATAAVLGATLTACLGYLFGRK